MVHLSSNGEILGEFEEHALASLVADGKIPSDAYFWREGMTEWLPLSEVPRAETPEPEPPPHASAAIELKPVVALPTNAPKAAVALPESAQSPAKRPFVARRGAAPSGALPMPRAAGSVASSALPPRTAPQAARTPPAGNKPLNVDPVPAGPGLPKQGRGWVLWLAGLLVSGAVAAGGAWWWIANAEPPVIPGNVALAGDETGPVEVRVFRRAELARPWQESLAAADARALELDGLLTAAQAQLREKSVFRDEAASVLKVGEEYNMPDVAELRADHDAKQAEMDAAQAEVEKLQSEKAALLSFEDLLAKLPPPSGTVVADAGGAFSLPPPEEDVVLLAATTAETDGKRSVRAWLEVLELPPEGEAHGPVKFSETNRLDLAEIRRFAAGDTD